MDSAAEAGDRAGRVARRPERAGCLPGAWDLETLHYGWQRRAKLDKLAQQAARAEYGIGVARVGQSQERVDISRGNLTERQRPARERERIARQREARMGKAKPSDRSKEFYSAREDAFRAAKSYAKPGETPLGKPVPHAVPRAEAYRRLWTEVRHPARRARTERASSRCSSGLSRRRGTEMQPGTIARRSYIRGRHDEMQRHGEWLDALVEDVADLVALAFLDGFEAAGVDPEELKERRATAVMWQHEYASRMLRAAALDWQGGRLPREGSSNL